MTNELARLRLAGAGASAGPARPGRPPAEPARHARQRGLATAASRGRRDMRTRAAGASPLGDDWLRWDPARIHRYPDPGAEPDDADDADALPPGGGGGSPAGRSEPHPAVELSCFLLAGFATGLAAALVLVAGVLLLG